MKYNYYIIIFKLIMSKNRSLQNYEFVKTIGEGTFGKVKLAIHKLTEEQVAIKILEKAKIKNKKDLERIEKEIKYMKFSKIMIIFIYQWNMSQVENYLII